MTIDPSDCRCGHPDATGVPIAPVACLYHGTRDNAPQRNLLMDGTLRERIGTYLDAQLPSDLAEVIEDEIVKHVSDWLATRAYRDDLSDTPHVDQYHHPILRTAKRLRMSEK